MKKRMKKMLTKTTALLAVTALALTGCGQEKQPQATEQTTSQQKEEGTLPQLEIWDGATVQSVGAKTDVGELKGAGISIIEDTERKSNVLSLNGKDGYFQLPKDIWNGVTEEFSISYWYRGAEDCNDGANVFQTNLCGYGMGDTYWRDAPELSLSVGGTFRAYIGGRTINGEYNPVATYNNGVGGDDKAYAEPGGHKTRYSATILTPDKSTWNHVVISVTSKEVHIYVNGIEQELTKQTETDDLASSLEYLFGTYEGGNNILKEYVNTSIGNSVYSDVPNFKGCVDDISIYHKAITGTEPLPEDMAYHWNFDTETITAPEIGTGSDLTKYMGDVALSEVTELKTTSPDQKTVLQIWNDDAGSFYYSVTDDSQVMIESSKLGMVLAEADLSTNLSFDASSKTVSEIDETYSLVTGAFDTATNHCNETRFVLKNEHGSFVVALRAYDDGVAYRYEDVTVTGAANVTVTKEASEVILPRSATTWAFQLNATYEGEYVERSTNQLEQLQQKLSTPMLAKVGSHYMLLTEAAAYNNNGEYCTSALETKRGSTVLTWAFGLARLPMSPSAGELDSPAHTDIQKVETVNGYTTPWRAFVISKDLNEFTGSRMIANLNPAPDSSIYSDLSYIKPGKVAWSWWSEGDAQGNYEKHIEYIDFAAEHGWEYMCIDAGWRGFENRLSELCSYAKDKGVGVFVWANYKDFKDSAEMERLFSSWAKAGVVGLKTDYFESDEPEVLKVMQDSAICAAKNRLMMLFHGCVRPGGEYRTYPNVLSMEAVQGEEWHKWFAYPTIKNCLMYTFTRNICGSMDYTPVGTKVGSNEATYGFGVGQTVVYESGLQHFAYAAESYQKYNGLSLLNHIPTSWNESKFIEGEPGSFVTMARRNGEEWFVGTMTLEARTSEISLDFLGDGTYNAYIYKDNEDGSKLVVETTQVTKSDTLSLSLLANGGAAVILTKETIDLTAGTDDEFNNPDYTYYEAERETNTLSGTAKTASSAFCSGGVKVGYVGNGAANTLTFNDIKVDKAGVYKLRLYYCCGEQRKVDFFVNEKDSYTMEQLFSGDYVHTAMKEIEITLEAGVNTIKLSQKAYYAPDIDQIAISKEPVK